MQATVSYLLMLQKYISSKQKDSEIKKYLLGFGDISGEFLANNKIKTGLNWNFYEFSVDFINI